MTDRANAALWRVVAAVILEDDMEDPAGRGLGLDRVEKANELLMPVALRAAAGDPAFEHIKRREQWWSCPCACNHGSSFRSGRARGQIRVGPVGRLDLRFLVDTKVRSR